MFPLVFILHVHHANALILDTIILLIRISLLKDITNAIHHSMNSLILTAKNARTYCDMLALSDAKSELLYTTKNKKKQVSSSWMKKATTKKPTFAQCKIDAYVYESIRP